MEYQNKDVIELKNKFEVLERQKEIVRNDFLQSQGDVNFIGKLRISDTLTKIQKKYLEEVAKIRLDQMSITAQLMKLTFKTTGNAGLTQLSSSLSEEASDRYDEIYDRKMRSTGDRIDRFHEFIDDKIDNFRSQDRYKNNPAALKNAIDRLENDREKFEKDIIEVRDSVLEEIKAMISKEFI